MLAFKKSSPNQKESEYKTSLKEMKKYALFFGSFTVLRGLCMGCSFYCQKKKFNGIQLKYNRTIIIMKRKMSKKTSESNSENFFSRL